MHFDPQLFGESDSGLNVTALNSTERLLFGAYLRFRCCVRLDAILFVNECVSTEPELRVAYLFGGSAQRPVALAQSYSRC